MPAVEGAPLSDWFSSYVAALEETRTSGQSFEPAKIARPGFGRVRPEYAASPLH